MNIERLRSLRRELITPTNPEWAEVLNLSKMMKDDFTNRGYLTLESYETVLDWKLRRQRNRTEKHRKDNTADLIREITGTFWRVRHPIEEKEIEIKLKVLKAVPGTGLGVASAILTLTFPENFAIIDFRNWQVLYNEEKRTFTLPEYIKKYLPDIRRLASQVQGNAREVDYLLWKEYENLGESGSRG